MGRIAGPTDPMRRIARPVDLMGKIASPTQNVSTLVILAPPKPRPAVLSLGGQKSVISYSRGLG